MRKSIVETIFFICGAHKGQKDKQGKPYWWHPVAVADMVGQNRGTDEEIMAALLHDVLEDTCYSAQDFIDMNCWDAYTLSIVNAVTKRSQETHREYIERIIRWGPDGAVLVKKCDIRHNLDPRRGPIPSGMIKRYEQSLVILEGFSDYSI